MAEEATSKFTSVTLGEQTGEAIEAPLLSDFVEQRYLPFAQENKRSWKADKGNLERHILPYLGASRLSDISTDTLMEWVRTLELIGLAYSSRFRLFWLVKSVLHCAVQWGVLPDSRNFASANLPAKPTRTPILLDSSEVIRLLDVLRAFPIARQPMPYI